MASFLKKKISTNVEDCKSVKLNAKRNLSKEEKEKLMCTDLTNGFTKEQQNAITYVRNACKKELAETPDFEEVVGDRRILRFLRGHKFDLELASEMFRGMLVWRQSSGVNEIRNHIVNDNLKPEQFPHHGRIMRYYPSHMDHGTDKDGRPLHIEVVGQVDPRKALSCFSAEEFIRHHLYCMEYNALQLDQLSVERNRLERMVLVYDLAGLGAGHLRKHGWDLIKMTLQITQDYYPESMFKTFVLNSPKVFTLAWAILKPLLAERTVNKISILGTNYLPKLTEDVPLESIPVSLGGSRADEWPLFFSKEDVNHLDEEYETITVGKGTSEVVSHPVDADSFVVWGFYTKSGDISVSISMSNGNEAAEAKDDDCATELETVKRTESCGGSFEVKSKGQLIMNFDNTFSWVNKKTVQYYICSVPLKDKTHLDSPRKGKLKSFFSE